MMRIKETETVKLVMRTDIEGRREKGRPKKRWSDIIET